MAALVLRKLVAITTSFKENKYWIPSGRDLGRDATGIPADVAVECQCFTTSFPGSSLY